MSTKTGVIKNIFADLNRLYLFLQTNQGFGSYSGPVCNL